MDNPAKPGRFDLILERLNKLAGILLPVIVALVGAAYTLQKDHNDELLREAQLKRDDTQRAFENVQKKYANLTALLPLLTSDRQDMVAFGLQIYQSEAEASLAPTDLQEALGKVTDRFKGLAPAVQLAIEAGRQQDARQCKAAPDGLYLQVANDDTQRAAGERLAATLREVPNLPTVRAVQRIDKGPQQTELRYYFSPANHQEADVIATALKAIGIPLARKTDLSRKYLKANCTPPPVFELWIGANTPLPAR